MTDDNDRHATRDSESLMMLGGFMTLLSLPVLAGTMYAETTRAMVVNVVAGLVLLAIGVGFFMRGWSRRKKTQ